MKGEITIPDYIILREKHPRRVRKTKNAILIAITVAAVIGMWLCCRWIEVGDVRNTAAPDIIMMVCVGWVVTFIYAQERGRRRDSDA